MRPVGAQPAPEFQQGLRVRHGAVPLVDGDAMPFHHRIEIVPRHVRVESARQSHCAQARRAPIGSESRELATHEPVVEARVVRHENATLETLTQLARNLCEWRSIGQHVVVDAGERADAGANAHVRIHQALPLELDCAVARANHRDVYDAIARPPRSRWSPRRQRRAARRAQRLRQLDPRGLELGVLVEGMQ